MTFHAFTQLGWTDGTHGIWRDRKLVPPRTGSQLDFWIDFARTAERGLFDSVFFADAMGMGGSAPGDETPEIRDGRLILWDPSVTISALAAATRDIGFLFTSSILQDHPFSFARRVSTLDEFTGGRVGWNIVTSYSPNAARNFGLADLPDREERYRWADEYAEAAYRLWEGSWADDAVVDDAAAATYVDPALVRTVDVNGERYRIRGPHLTPPTPQRTPVLVQAGGSPAGRSFAAKHAEMQFMALAHEAKMAADIAAVRELAVGHGRRAEDIDFIVSVGFVVGSTEQEARRKADRLDDAADDRDLLAYLGSEVGVDLTGIGLDDPLPDLVAGSANAGMSGVRDAILSTLPADRVPTVRDVIRNARNRNRIVGTPEQIADRLQALQSLGVGGIAVGESVRPGSLVDFVDHVIPVLQQRGLAQREYQPGTLRRKLTGRADRLPERHPAARHRHYPPLVRTAAPAAAAQ